MSRILARPAPKSKPKPFIDVSNYVPSYAGIQAYADGVPWAIRTGTSKAPQGGWGKRKSKVGRGIRRLKYSATGAGKKGKNKKGRGKKGCACTH